MKNVDCPYLARSTSHSEQYSGYCALKRLGDWENKNTLLWDKVKECDHNETDYLALAKRYDHYKLLPKITNAEQAYERALYHMSFRRFSHIVWLNFSFCFENI